MKQINLIYYSVFFLWYLLSLLPLRFLYFISDLLFIRSIIASATDVNHTQ